MPDDTRKSDVPPAETDAGAEPERPERDKEGNLVDRASKVAAEVGSVLNETGRKLMEEFRALGKREGETGDGLGGEIQDKLRALGKDIASLLDSVAAKASTDIKKVSRDVRSGLADAIRPHGDKTKSEGEGEGGAGGDTTP